jgi:hypothetical protein
MYIAEKHGINAKNGENLRAKANALDILLYNSKNKLK